MGKKEGYAVREKAFSQESLKLMACITMLIDHIGATVIPDMNLRIIGRLAFPIFCFLLVEGIRHTRNVKKYAARLAIGALLSEIPFDLLFFGQMTWAYQSVMLTLLLGLVAVCWGKKKNNYWLPFAVCFFVAEFLNTDYGGWGVALICLFAITEEKPSRHLLQMIGMALIFWCMGSYVLTFGFVRIPIEFFALLSLIPIWLYSGKKLTRNRVAQWAYYLFYPVHMMVLLFLAYPVW